MLIIRLPHCLTAIVRHGRTPKLNCTKWKYLRNSFTMDKHFVKVLLTKAVRYVYTYVYINIYILVRKKTFIKEKSF